MNYLLSLSRDARTILLHRLAVPDCIAEALADDYPEEVVEQACHVVAQELRGSRPMIPASALERAILVDAADGSTFFGNCEEWTPGQSRKWNRAADEIERVLSAMDYGTVRVPRM